MPHALLQRLLMSLGCRWDLLLFLRGRPRPLGDSIMVNTTNAGNQRPIYFFYAGSTEKNF